MTQQLSFCDYDEASSSSMHSSGLFNDFEFGEEILKEEQRLLVENESLGVEDNSNDSLFEDIKTNLKTEEQLIKEREEEIKKLRYKRLMHLLENSKMYSLILKNRIKDETNLSQREMKNGAKFKVCEVINEETIDQNIQANESKNTELTDEDYFKETRITNLGFCVSSKQPLLLEGATMRTYQLQGLDWMKILFSNGVNGILADEMGLGKTIQVIAFICHMIENDIKGPFLIVAPLSTISNWMAEFKRFAPKVPTMLYHGPEDQRRMLIPKILQMSRIGNRTVHKVIITSYQVPLRDKVALGKINWYYLIIDEGHRIKNHNSQLSRTLRKFNTIGRLLLTGTPLQNDLSELWSLLNFLLPEVFNTLGVFESWFDIKELESNGTQFMKEKLNIDVVNVLQEILVPFLLRREKKDVNLQLPPKKEILINCPLTSSQKELYEAFLNRSIEILVKPKNEFDMNQPLPKRRCFLNSPYGKKEEKKKVRNSSKKVEEREEERFLTKLVLQNPQIQLRKIVNHPYLIQYPLKVGTEELRIDEGLVTSSGKMLVLDAMLDKLKAKGHKVIIFSYFTTVLDILEDHAIMRGYKYCRLDGKQKISDRDEEILNFISDPDIFVFYVSIRAGGLGINLTAADTVIFYDSDWNPQMNLQSADRCHRIGQTKPVMVYRLCAKGTIDEKIIERGNAKRRLEKMILQKGYYAASKTGSLNLSGISYNKVRRSNFLTQCNNSQGKFTLNSKNSRNLNLMDLQELKPLLESTDHDTVINSNGYVLTDEQLEALLDRSDMINGELPQEGSENKVFKVLNYD